GFRRRRPPPFPPPDPWHRHPDPPSIPARGRRGHGCGHVPAPRCARRRAGRCRVAGLCHRTAGHGGGRSVRPASPPSRSVPRGRLTMAVAGDFTFLRLLIDRGVVTGPVLEIGSRAWQGAEEGNAKAVCVAAGLQWEGTDIVEGEGVDFVLDILDAGAVAAVGRQWPAVLLFNLLEHVYNPIVALEHACRLVAPGGVIVVVGPAVWQLHDYPRDYWRPMPDFFLAFGEHNGYEVPFDLMMWIVEDKAVTVSSFSIEN